MGSIRNFDSLVVSLRYEPPVRRLSHRCTRVVALVVLCLAWCLPVMAVHAAETPDQGVNILLLGSDARPGEQIDRTRSDIIMVLHFNPKSGSCGLLSVPRDSRVEVPGIGLTKINHGLMMGGIPLEKETVSNYLGLAIDHYVLIDFVGARQGIDALGGITVQNDYDFSLGTDHFPIGPVKLNGTQAVKFARFRGGPDGDFGRIRRQHLVFQGAMLKVRAMSLSPLITQSWTAFAGHYMTDMTAKQVIDLATRYRSTCTSKSIKMLTINGSVASFDDPIFNVSLSYVVSDPAEVQRKVDQLLAS